MTIQDAALRDLIYFDFQKAASLYSQIEQGLPQETRQTSESASNKKGSAGVNLPVAKGEVGGEIQQKTSIYESRVLHHDLLSKLEAWLSTNGLICDLNTFLGKPDYSNEAIRERLADPTFLLVEGSAAFHDYNRFKEYLSGLNDLLEFFHRAAAEELKKSDAYKSMEQQIQTLRQQAESEKNPAEKGRKRKLVKDVEQALEAMIAPISGALDDWQVKGFNNFVDMLMPNRLDLLIAPYRENSEFHIVANLKRDCFVDSNVENVMFSYGLRPNNPITVFGLTTDIPPKRDEAYDPFEESNASGDQERVIEQALRSIFTSVKQVERFVRFSVYPNVTVYPIAVYRRLGSLLPDKTALLHDE